MTQNPRLPFPWLRQIFGSREHPRRGQADVPFALRLTGGIGDHLIAARYVRDLIAAVGPFRFDIYSSRPEIAEWIFAFIPGVNACYSEFLEWLPNFKSYALSLWITQFVVLHSTEADWRRAFTHNRKLAKVCESIWRFRPNIDHHISRHPLSDGFMAQEAVIRGANRYNFNHLMSGIAYGGDRLSLESEPTALAKYGLADQPYITVHNGFDDAFLSDDNRAPVKGSTKVYPGFAAVIDALHREFKGLRTVQLGISTSQPISGVGLNLINRTTLPETAEILRHSQLHLDNESGLVHMAACLGVKSCVIFGPTSPDFFAYDENINIRPNFCGSCWWLTRDWMARCPRGYHEARCLTEQPPNAIVEAIRPHLVQTLQSVPNPTSRDRS